MFFVFNPISLVICIMTSIVLFFFLRKDKLNVSTNGKINFIVVLIINILVGFLGWLQISILFKMMMEPNIDNYSSLPILFAFPIWTGLLTIAVKDKIK